MCCGKALHLGSRTRRTCEDFGSFFVYDASVFVFKTMARSVLGLLPKHLLAYYAAGVKLLETPRGVSGRLLTGALDNFPRTSYGELQLRPREASVQQRRP